ncbi:hypothetical protein BYT27DRAFT_7217327 [Phlegmacium glaucopus]|nr:hypothetical protein BYT27DRAFT_7217327 [Phlegmacium glaucopus]
MTLKKLRACKGCIMGKQQIQTKSLTTYLETILINKSCLLGSNSSTVFIVAQHICDEHALPSSEEGSLIDPSEDESQAADETPELNPKGEGVVNHKQAAVELPQLNAKDGKDKGKKLATHKKSDQSDKRSQYQIDRERNIQRNTLLLAEVDNALKARYLDVSKKKAPVNKQRSPDNNTTPHIPNIGASSSADVQHQQMSTSPAVNDIGPANDIVSPSVAVDPISCVVNNAGEAELVNDTPSGITLAAPFVAFSVSSTGSDATVKESMTTSATLPSPSVVEVIITPPITLTANINTLMSSPTGSDATVEESMTMSATLPSPSVVEVVITPPIMLTANIDTLMSLPTGADATVEESTATSATLPSPSIAEVVITPPITLTVNIEAPMSWPTDADATVEESTTTSATLPSTSVMEVVTTPPIMLTGSVDAQMSSTDARPVSSNTTTPRILCASKPEPVWLHNILSYPVWMQAALKYLCCAHPSDRWVSLLEAWVIFEEYAVADGVHGCLLITGCY